MRQVRVLGPAASALLIIAIDSKFRSANRTAGSIGKRAGGGGGSLRTTSAWRFGFSAELRALGARGVSCAPSLARAARQ